MITYKGGRFILRYPKNFKPLFPYFIIKKEKTKMPEMSPITKLLSEFNTKLRDLEERQRLIKDRVLLIGGNLVDFKENTVNEVSELKVRTEKIEKEIERMKEIISSLIEESKNYARKSELEILYRQFRMFQPFIEKDK